MTEKGNVDSVGLHILRDELGNKYKSQKNKYKKKSNTSMKTYY